MKKKTPPFVHILIRFLRYALVLWNYMFLLQEFYSIFRGFRETCQTCLFFFKFLDEVGF